MAGRFESTIVIDRPIDEVFAFLADGKNDRSSARGCSRSPRRPTGRPVSGRSTRARSRTRGIKTKREFELTEFVPPTRIRWAELSKNIVIATEGGYDLAPAGDGTRVTRLQRARGTRLREADRPVRAALGAQGRGRLRAADQGRRRGVLTTTTVLPGASSTPAARAPRRSRSGASIFLASRTALTHPGELELGQWEVGQVDRRHRDVRQAIEGSGIEGGSGRRARCRSRRAAPARRPWRHGARRRGRAVRAANCARRAARLPGSGSSGSGSPSSRTSSARVMLDPVPRHHGSDHDPVAFDDGLRTVGLRRRRRAPRRSAGARGHPTTSSPGRPRSGGPRARRRSWSASPCEHRRSARTPQRPQVGRRLRLWSACAPTSVATALRAPRAPW